MHNKERWLITVGTEDEATEIRKYKDGTGIIKLRSDIEEWLEDNVPDRNWSWCILTASREGMKRGQGIIQVSVRDKQAATQFKLIFGVSEV